MTTLELPGPVPATSAEVTPEAVQAHIARLTADLGGSLGVLLMSLGNRSGLWRALDGAGPLSARQLADRVTVDPALVREWLRAEAAAGYVDYDPRPTRSNCRPPRRQPFPTVPALPWSRHAWRCSPP